MAMPWMKPNFRRPGARGALASPAAVVALLIGMWLPSESEAAGARRCHRIRSAATLLSLTLRAGVDPPRLAARAGNLRRENAVTHRERLSRIPDPQTLRRFVRARLLVPVPERGRTFVVHGVRPELRVARPWTHRFIVQLAAGYHALFGAPLKITGLTRTIDFQRTLRRTNGNAALPAASSHVTGAAVDIGTGGMPARGRAWLRHVLSRLTREGVVLAIEESRYPHFHVVVRRSYLGYARTVSKPWLIGAC
jgi:hypothetical protein